MVIYSEKLIHLDIDPKTDILKIKWPNLVDEPISVVQPAIDKILKSIRLFQVSKLLIDTKDTKTNISEEDFRKFSKEFIEVLIPTNLKKLARIVYAHPLREIRAQILIEDLSAWLSPDFESREFTDEKSALAWLENGGI